MTFSQATDGTDGLQKWTAAANITERSECRTKIQY